MRYFILILLMIASCGSDQMLDGDGKLLAGDVLLPAGHYYIDKSIRLAPHAVLRADGVVIFDGQVKCNNILIGSSHSRIEGITFVNGYANGEWPRYNGAAIFMFHINGMIVRGCNFISNYTRKRGGGIYCFKSSCEVIDCHFEDNVACTRGAGIHGTQSILRILNCDFLNNRVTGPLPPNPDNVDAGYGGGIHISNQSHALIQGCEFKDNWALLGHPDVYVGESSSVEWE